MAGQLTAQIDERGNRTTFTYDPVGRQTEITDALNYKTIFAYDKAGRRTSVKDALDRTTSYQYDALGRQTKTIFADGTFTTTEYDKLGRRTAAIDQMGYRTEYEYDALNRLTAVEDALTQRTVYGYDELGRMISQTDALNRTTRFEYDKVGQRTGRVLPLGQRYSYSYDASGKRLTRNSDAYNYNNGYQLQSIVSQNRTETYGFDDDGRVATINRNGETIDLDHDNYDQLLMAGDVRYQYDGEGRRVKAIEGSEERRFLQAPIGDLDVLELLTDEAGNVISDYVYGNGITPIAKLDNSGSPIYYLTDAMGSVIGEVDDSGNLVKKIRYDAFGNIRSESGAISTATRGDFRFQGQWLESESGLYYFRARDYDARSGLFLSRDAIEPDVLQPENANPYQFAYQNPNIYSDPSGKFTLLELNTSSSIEKQLASIRQYAGNQAKEYIKQRIGDSFGEVVASVFNSFIPGVDFNIINNVVNISFEDILKDRICEYFEGIPLLQYLTLFPQVSQFDGSAMGGFSCQSNSNLALKNPLPGNSRPDFIFHSGSLSVRKSPHSYLIGDVKTTQTSASRDVLDNDNQWTAISKFASNYEALPFASYISLLDRLPNESAITSSTKKQLAQKAAARGVILVLVNFVEI